MSTDAPQLADPSVSANPFRGMPIGWPVLFYVNGERGHQPAPAIVFRNHGNGVLDLVELRWGRDTQQREAVRHIDDPMFKTNTALRQQRGCWDYVMGLKLPDNLPVFTSGMNPDGVETTVMTLAAAGQSKGEIANALGLAAKKVAEIIDRYSASLP